MQPLQKGVVWILARCNSRPDPPILPRSSKVSRCGVLTCQTLDAAREIRADIPEYSTVGHHLVYGLHEIVQTFAIAMSPSRRWDRNIAMSRCREFAPTAIRMPARSLQWGCKVHAGTELAWWDASRMPAIF